MMHWYYGVFIIPVGNATIRDTKTSRGDYSKIQILLNSIDEQC